MGNCVAIIAELLKPGVTTPAGSLTAIKTTKTL